MTNVTRTILITFSDHTVFRNLFLFPGGFFDQLRERLASDKGTRVVFLMRTRDKEKYDAMFDTDLKDRLIACYADAPARTTSLRKLFRFFYAYFVFTDTTKILVTIGMRVGEPPAASNKLLTPVRWLIAHTVGKMTFMRRRFVPWLFSKIYEHDRTFKDVFDVYKPDLVFSAHIYGDYDAHVLAEARRRGIRTVGMPSGWDHVDKYFLPFHVDRLFVPSEQVATHAMKFQGYSRSEISITGYPHFDFFTSKRAEMPREEILKRFSLPPGSRYIFYVSGSSYCPDEPDIIEQVLQWIEEGVFGPDIRLVLRPYLGSRSKDREFDEKKFKRIATHPKVVYYDHKSWDTLEGSIVFMNLMRHAAAVMCVYSSVFLEAAIFGSPLVATPFDGHHVRPYSRSIRRFSDFEHFKEVLEVGAIRETYSFGELKKALVEYLKDPSIDQKKRERMRREVCAISDGRASARLLDAVFAAVPEVRAGTL